MRKTKKAVAQPKVLACSAKYRLSELGDGSIILELCARDALGDRMWVEVPSSSYTINWRNTLAELVRSVPSVRTEFVTKYISDKPCDGDAKARTFYGGACFGAAIVIATIIMIVLAN